MITKFNFNDHTIKSYAIRKLTPKECFRLMGVREDTIRTMQSTVKEAQERMADGANVGGKQKADDMMISASQQYKQAGNSIVVSVLVGIMNNLFYPPEEKTITFDDGITYKVQDDGQFSFF